MPDTTHPAPIDLHLLKPATEAPAAFRIREVPQRDVRVLDAEVTPDLGPLAAFKGTFTGTGFNTIFRPLSSATPTTFPGPVATSDPADNVLELNLTQETLSFSDALGSVPNRGLAAQADAFLNGVPYLQSIADITNTRPVGIHLEPGLWVIVPATTNPAEVPTVARMASIPHGTTINAQGTWKTFAGPPTIPAVSITPTFISNNSQFHFQNQDVTNAKTRRIPQDLSSFVAAGTITQAIVDDPNTVLRNAIAGQHIVSTTQIDIDTTPHAPITGGGNGNIAFLQPNANAVRMTATFWIETVEHIIVVPPWMPGHPPLTLRPENVPRGALAPTFTVQPSAAITKAHRFKFHTIQIQYSQNVNLQFAGLNWPHVSVATLIPAASVHITPVAWARIIAPHG